MSRVLVVDDDPTNLHVVSRALRGAGFAVLRAATGRDALDLLKQEPCDLVVSGLDLPDISGLDVLRRLRADHNCIRFIVMTDYGTARSAAEAFKSGATDFVERPLAADVLVQAVRSAISAKPGRRRPRTGRRGLVARAATRTRSDARVREVIRQIESRLGQPVSTDELATLVELSPSRLRHVFRSVVGKSLSRWRKERRLEVAAELLVRSRKRVSEIAFEVGFSDPAYFDRAFRRQFGVCPRAFRAANRV